VNSTLRCLVSPQFVSSSRALLGEILWPVSCRSGKLCVTVPSGLKSIEQVSKSQMEMRHSTPIDSQGEEGTSLPFASLKISCCNLWSFVYHQLNFHNFQQQNTQTLWVNELCKQFFSTLFSSSHDGSISYFLMLGLFTQRSNTSFIAKWERGWEEGGRESRDNQDKSIMMKDPSPLETWALI